MSGGAGFLQSTVEPIFMDKKTKFDSFFGVGRKNMFEKSKSLLRRSRRQAHVLTSDGESPTVFGAEHFHYLRVRKTRVNTTGKSNNLNGYGISTTNRNPREPPQETRPY